jgi:hypothetical protein
VADGIKSEPIKIVEEYTDDSVGPVELLSEMRNALDVDPTSREVVEIEETETLEAEIEPEKFVELAVMEVAVIDVAVILDAVTEPEKVASDVTCNDVASTALLTNEIVPEVSEIMPSVRVSVPEPTVIIDSAWRMLAEMVLAAEMLTEEMSPPTLTESPTTRVVALVIESP